MSAPHDAAQEALRVIRAARADGIYLWMENGRLVAAPRGNAFDTHLPALREHCNAIVAALERDPGLGGAAPGDSEAKPHAKPRQPEPSRQNDSPPPKPNKAAMRAALPTSRTCTRASSATSWSIAPTQAARDIWTGVYPRLSEGMPGLFGAATARGEAQALRLAMPYALLDEKVQIDGPHLLAGLAVWERAEASARHVFGASLGDPVADEILRAVRSAGQDGMTRTQIRDLFKRHCSAERIGAALVLLERRRLVRRRSQETGGRPTEIWSACEVAT